jgi:hypothetical protein
MKVILFGASGMVGSGAAAIARAGTDMPFCFISGTGTDSTERGRVMWARVKGKTENAILAMPFRAAFMFRPGYIQPMKGVRSKTPLYQGLYNVLAPLYPLIRRVAPGFVTTSETIGRALMEVAQNGYERQILETVDINRVGGRV